MTEVVTGPKLLTLYVPEMTVHHARRWRPPPRPAPQIYGKDLIVEQVVPDIAGLLGGKFEQLPIPTELVVQVEVDDA